MTSVNSSEFIDLPSMSNSIDDYNLALRINAVYHSIRPYPKLIELAKLTGQPLMAKEVEVTLHPVYFIYDP